VIWNNSCWYTFQKIEDFDLDQQTLEGISAGIVSDHFADIYDNAYEAILRMEKRSLI
jgi:2-oxoglutarate dehydrogenase E1 component